jgi:hypothetical protein
MLDVASQTLTREQQRVLNVLLAEGMKIPDPHVRSVFNRAAIETGLVESGLTNPSGGDADSAGWRQERASLYPNPTNLRASAARFRQEFLQAYRPGLRSYNIAAAVQRPAAQYRGRYHDVAHQAAAILRAYSGSGSPVSPGSSAASLTAPSPGPNGSVDPGQSPTPRPSSTSSPSASSGPLPPPRRCPSRQPSRGRPRQARDLPGLPGALVRAGAGAQAGHQPASRARADTRPGLWWGCERRWRPCRGLRAVRRG